MKNYFNKYGWLAIILILWLGYLLTLFNSCENPKPVPSTGLKPEIKRQDSFRTIIRYQDSVRIKELVKWHNLTRINDSAPCYTEIKTIIQECDTVIRYDSVEISSLNGQHLNDLVIQKKQDSILTMKSDTIKTLRRKLKFQKLKTKGALLIGILGGGYLGSRIGH